MKLKKTIKQTLKQLKALGLDFKPSSSKNIYKCIKNDLCGGDLSYFRDEFYDIVKQVNNSKAKEAQFNALKDLVLYSAALLVTKGAPKEWQDNSLITLRDGNNAWELRIYINRLLKKLKDIKFQLIPLKESGAYKLASVKDAHQLGLCDSRDEREMFRKLAEQLAAQEPLELACPEQVRNTEPQEWDQLKLYCSALNDRLGFRLKSRDNIFSFSDQRIPYKLLEYIRSFLPNLRIFIMQLDDGQPFLIPGELKIHTLLTECLIMIANREKELQGQPTNNTEENDTTRNEISGLRINGDTTIIVGDNTNNQQNP